VEVYVQANLKQLSMGFFTCQEPDLHDTYKKTSLIAFVSKQQSVAKDILSEMNE